ncbi:hypothetical protein HPB50_023672 [Hyalomma asiaticum]|uniref:Uncharacterized protein n=1 Tax=Hyalomma asiaticum TaxID=266040 RepID=A0ACB7T3W9_HYAAI|nr:hypothetical protein HPB50_023672 [Hyalomma asiaticum]
MPATVEVEGMEESPEEVEDAGWTAAFRSRKGDVRKGSSGGGQRVGVEVSAGSGKVQEAVRRGLRDLAELKAAFESFKERAQGDRKEPGPLWGKAKCRALDLAEGQSESTAAVVAVQLEAARSSVAGGVEDRWARMETTLSRMMDVLSSLEGRITVLERPKALAKVGKTCGATYLFCLALAWWPTVGSLDTHFVAHPVRGRHARATRLRPALVLQHGCDEAKFEYAYICVYNGSLWSSDGDIFQVVPSPRFEHVPIRARIDKFQAILLAEPQHIDASLYDAYFTWGDVLAVPGPSAYDRVQGKDFRVSDVIPNLQNS